MCGKIILLCIVLYIWYVCLYVYVIWSACAYICICVGISVLAWRRCCRSMCAGTKVTIGGAIESKFTNRCRTCRRWCSCRNGCAGRDDWRCIHHQIFAQLLMVMMVVMVVMMMWMRMRVRMGVYMGVCIPVLSAQICFGIYIRNAFGEVLEFKGWKYNSLNFNDIF